ncbi:hypothetical protein O4U47_07660 [Nocardiopsis sp. LSu2-4]|uniref:Uncharacterized protein n=1 Tax=Nocardiopsis suaedae TaxID=3018444 RepID=A0ABT4TI90_9ACTN|nr:hypothetical protein [Nocardiopsis suaedae]MDA2804386.1 hypothetical protein [Nocardiopsis suaedae]
MIHAREDRWDLGLRGPRVESVEERGDGVRIAVAAPLASGDAVDVLQTLIGTKVLVSIAFPAGHLRLVFGDGRHITAPGRGDPVSGPADWAPGSSDGVLIRAVRGGVEVTGAVG